MKAGDLVKPMVTCAGELGEQKCQSAVILSKGPGWTARDDEFELICTCGIWEEHEGNLEVINEGR